MIDCSTQIVPHLLTVTNEFHHSTVTVNNPTPVKFASNALLQKEGDFSGLFLNQRKLNALTPVYASSLYWLI